MNIKDKYGGLIEITDLDKALEQAEWFKDAHHIPPAKSDTQRQEYWLDVYNKLMELKNADNNDKKCQL